MRGRSLLCWLQRQRLCALFFRRLHRGCVDGGGKDSGDREADRGVAARADSAAPRDQALTRVGSGSGSPGVDGARAFVPGSVPIVVGGI